MGLNVADAFLIIPAVVVSQPIGEFFLCSIPARALLEVTYSIPASMKRRDGMFSSVFGNQRLLSVPRAKQIGAYIDEEESTFPNTVILSANYSENGDYAEDETTRWHASEGPHGSFVLTIPTTEKLASIIDGQHRLEGFKHISKPARLNMGVPCAVYINLPRPYQARIFATININQKHVDKSLAYELFGYDLNESNTGQWPPDMLGVYLARILEGTEGSPFKGHIRLALLEEDEEVGEEGEIGRWQVSVACLVEGITRLISAKPSSDRSALASGEIKDRAQLPADNAPWREYYVEGQDKTILELVNDYFVVVEELVWNNQGKGSFITRTVGVLALFDVLREASLAKLIDLKHMRTSAKAFLENARDIDFGDDFFHASGAGRVRIRNVLKTLVGLPAKSNDAVAEAVSRLIAKRATNK